MDRWGTKGLLTLAALGASLALVDITAAHAYAVLILCLMLFVAATGAWRWIRQGRTASSSSNAIERNAVGLAPDRTRSHILSAACSAVIVVVSTSTS